MSNSADNKAKLTLTSIILANVGYLFSYIFPALNTAPSFILGIMFGAVIAPVLATLVILYLKKNHLNKNLLSLSAVAFGYLSLFGYLVFFTLFYLLISQGH